MSWGLIGGSGPLGLTGDFEPVAEPPATAYGAPSPGLARGRLAGQDVVFLPRHGVPHRTAPHLINYRANVEALRRLGVEGVIALNTAGGISAPAAAGAVVVPDQLIDYTWGRAHTFADADQLLHVDFAEPFDETLRLGLLAAAQRAGEALVAGGVYGCTQGPRFETAAEIERMARDGCDVVGMTGMPEAALAREARLPYAMLTLVVNPAAGRAPDPFDMAAIAEVAATGMARIERLLLAFFEGREGRA